MIYSKESWEEKRKRGLRRYLMVDGLIFAGGPFAVAMQIIGVFLLRGENESVGQYLAAERTWVTFLLQGALFGLAAGFINWRRNEKAFAARGNGGPQHSSKASGGE